MLDIRRFTKFPTAAAAAAALILAPVSGLAQAAAPIKIGVITFLSGPAAAPFGVPAKNSANLMVDTLNKGGVLPAPYQAKGFGGAKIKTVFVDEAGGSTRVVTEFRNLVQRDKVDLVIGVISSGDCLALAPVADELKEFTDFFDCGTPRVFEDGSYKYVFRTGPTSTMDSVGAALYVRDIEPNLKSVAGINPNYAWGQDSWSGFLSSLKNLFPNVEVKNSLMPKLFVGSYSTDISTLLQSKPQVIHSALWSGDLDALLLQAAPRGLFKKSIGVLTTGETEMDKMAAEIPDGTIIGARGPFGPYAPNTPLAHWFYKAFKDRYHTRPIYPAYKMSQAFLGIKAAWEKAQAANGGKRPSSLQVAAALQHLTFEGPGGTVSMALGNGHQAVMEMAYGMSKVVNGKMTITNIKRYPADEVNPPDGMTSAAWIKNGFKR